MCMGGALAFSAALVLDDVISAAGPFYGIPDQRKYQLENIKIPVQVKMHGHQDGWCIFFEPTCAFCTMGSYASLCVCLYVWTLPKRLDNNSK